MLVLLAPDKIANNPVAVAIKNIKNPRNPENIKTIIEMKINTIKDSLL